MFLDEIGDLALELQPKLLKVLETQAFRRLGGSNEISVDTRLIVATHQDLDRAVAEGSFREDLFYRLKVTTLHLPAVRERPVEDRVALLHRLLRDLRGEFPRAPTAIGEDALDCLAFYSWPGNVREMRNVLERALLFGAGCDEVLKEHLPAEVRRGAKVRRSGGFTPQPLREVERRHIERVLLHHEGNRTRAAKDLGIARATLINKIKAYGP